MLRLMKATFSYMFQDVLLHIVCWEQVGFVRNVDERVYVAQVLSRDRQDLSFIA